MSGMRTAVATDEPLPDGETDFVRFLKARLAGIPAGVAALAEDD
jgi:hypothetical protein